MKKYIVLILFIMLSVAYPASPLLAKDKAVTPEHAYNMGIDFYKKLDYNKAIDKFLNAFNTENNKLEQWINYNLGSAAFEKGQKAQKSNPQEAQQAYKQALEFFHRAIELNPQDKNAKYNYELTALKLKEAQQQEQKNKEQQKDQQQKEEQDKQDKQDQSDNKQEQASDKQDQQGKKPRQQEAQPQEMTEEQAKMLLENFQNSEDGPTELRLLDQEAQTTGVEKDW